MHVLYCLWDEGSGNKASRKTSNSSECSVKLHCKFIASSGAFTDRSINV